MLSSPVLSPRLQVNLCAAYFSLFFSFFSFTNSILKPAKQFVNSVLLELQKRMGGQ